MLLLTPWSSKVDTNPGNNSRTARLAPGTIANRFARAIVLSISDREPGERYVSVENGQCANRVEGAVAV